MRIVCLGKAKCRFADLRNLYRKNVNFSIYQIEFKFAYSTYPTEHLTELILQCNLQHFVHIPFALQVIQSNCEQTREIPTPFLSELFRSLLRLFRRIAGEIFFLLVNSKMFRAWK